VKSRIYSEKNIDWKLSESATLSLFLPRIRVVFVANFLDHPTDPNFRTELNELGKKLLGQGTHVEPQMIRVNVLLIIALRPNLNIIKP